MQLQANKSLEEYHFAGDGIWKPKTIKASSPEEAEKLWLQQRESVEPEKPREENIN